MVMTGRLFMVWFPLYVRNYQTFLNLSVKLKLALPGITTGGITGVVISGATSLKALSLIKERLS